MIRPLEDELAQRPAAPRPNTGPGRASLSPEALRFRKLVIDALWPHLHAGYYLGRDHFVGVCAICGGPVGVRFRGRAPHASFNCHLGCSEAQLAEALGLEFEADQGASK